MAILCACSVTVCIPVCLESVLTRNQHISRSFLCVFWAASWHNNCTNISADICIIVLARNVFDVYEHAYKDSFHQWFPSRMTLVLCFFFSIYIYCACVYFWRTLSLTSAFFFCKIIIYYIAFTCFIELLLVSFMAAVCCTTEGFTVFCLYFLYSLNGFSMDI